MLLPRYPSALRVPMRCYLTARHVERMVVDVARGKPSKELVLPRLFQLVST